MTVQNGKLIIEPQLCPCYSLDELLAQCDAMLELNHEGYAHIGVKS